MGLVHANTKTQRVTSLGADLRDILYLIKSYHTCRNWRHLPPKHVLYSAQYIIGTRLVFRSTLSTSVLSPDESKVFRDQLVSPDVPRLSSVETVSTEENTGVWRESNSCALHRECDALTIRPRGHVLGAKTLARRCVAHFFEYRGERRFQHQINGTQANPAPALAHRSLFSRQVQEI